MRHAGACGRTILSGMAGAVASSVVIVGGGAAAVCVAVALRERALSSGSLAPRITVVGRESTVGRGVAYGRADPHHRLNSPAGKMSVSTSEDDGFLRWLDQTGWRDVDGRPAEAGSYVPRRVFGDYVEAQFHGLVAAAPDDVRFIEGDVVAVEPSSSGVTVVLADEIRLLADSVILALGNPAPARVASPAPGPSRQVDDPWAPGALDDIADSDRVLLVGTGLTMVDIATSLGRRVPGVRLTATSRHLLLPAVHLSGPVPPGPGLIGESSTVRLGALISAFGRQLRVATNAGSPWQPVLDGVRPQIHALWPALSAADRERFLTHVARRWDVHRHRMALSVWDELAGLLSSGALTLSTPATVSAEKFDVIVNCTGPASLASRGWSPLVDSLLDSGVVAPDPTGIGFDADGSGALVSASGVVSDHLFTLGAGLKGALWESVAIPEIRQVAARIAERVVPPAGLPRTDAA